MKKAIYLTCMITSVPVFTMAQWPSNVAVDESKSNDTVSVSGDLTNGARMADLSWAANSSNACFVSLQNGKFRGNHLLYATTFPPHSIMTVSVTPTDANGDLSIYGYMLGGTEHRVVPNLPSCITCV